MAHYRVKVIDDPYGRNPGVKKVFIVQEDRHTTYDHTVEIVQGSYDYEVMVVNDERSADWKVIVRR